MAFQERSGSEVSDGGANSPAVPSIDSLYRTYAAIVRRAIERRFGYGPPDPEDAVQAAFLKFAAMADRSTVLQPLPFLKRCAHNFVIDYHRDQKMRVTHDAGIVELAETCDEFDAERVLLGKQRAAVLETAIAEMDEKFREVLIMVRIQGLTGEETAQRIGVSRTLVRVRLAKAVEICSRALRKVERP